MKRLKTIFFLIIVLTSNISLAFGATNEGYGEDSSALGQFVDTYTSLDNITVNVDTVRNALLNAMELNYSAMITKVYADPYVREHDFYVDSVPGLVASIGGNDYISITSGNSPKGGAEIFFIIDRAWLADKYIRFRWNGYYSGASPRTPVQVLVVDVEWDRTNDAHFPEGSHYGEQLYRYIRSGFLGWFGWEIRDLLMTNVSTGSSINATLAFYLGDGWSGNNLALYLDWMEINTGVGGTGNLITINFNNSTPLIMEQLGTQDDYGYVNETILPYFIGGYVNEGYFTSTDYLSNPIANGSAIVHMSNTSIPTGTGIMIEFSSDNVTWILNDWEPLFGGFESIDLRGLNYSTRYYTRHNMTSTGTNTPRVYQSRLITTIGNSTVGVPSVGGGINSATILMLILLFTLAILIYWGIKRR